MNHEEIYISSENRLEEVELFKEIKNLIGEDYPTFKRNSDVYFEVFKIQCLLFSPFLGKNMFNFLTIKLLKLEKERLGLDEIRKALKNYPITDQKYYYYYLYKMEKIKDKYNVVNCLQCHSNLSYGGDEGPDICVDCLKRCRDCRSSIMFCECDDFRNCCESLNYCECDECGNCKNFNCIC